MLARYPFRAMGGPCELHLHGESRAALDALARDAHQEIARLERKYTRYRDDSLTAEINRSAGRSEGVCVDPETAALLDYAETVYVESGGLFDVSSGVLREAWDFRSGRLPEASAVEALRARVGWRRVRWEAPRLVLPAGMEIDFGGFVKEYAADRVAELARRAGCRAGLVDLGGDLCCIGPHPDGSPWLVGIRDPRSPERALTSLSLLRGGLATSGDTERCMVVDGVRYGHILDPRTGWPVDGLSSVSVAASHCLIAGTASTVAMLKGRRGAADWLDALSLPHVTLDRDGTLAVRLEPERIAA